MKKNKFLILFIVVVGCIFSIFAQSPQKDINMRNFYGMYNATNVTADYFIGTSDFCIVGGDCLSNVSDVNKTYVDSQDILYNNSIKIYADSQDILYNNSIKIYADNTFITLLNEGNLNVNSSDFWDGITSQSNIVLNWTQLQNYPVSCPADTYITQLDDIVTCTAISDDYLSNTGDTGTGDYSFINNVTIKTFNFESYSGNTETQVNRSFHNNNEINVSVCFSGCDYTTIQDAVNTIPFYINYDYKILVDDGTYNEDVLVPYSLITRTNPSEGNESTGLIIQGNIDNPTNVKVNSFFFDGGVGFTQLNGFSIQSDTPYDNEAVGIGIYGYQELELNKITFEESSGTNGIMCYNSRCRGNGIEFGNNILSGFGVKVKHLGWFGFDTFNFGYGANGTLGTYVYNIADGMIFFEGSDSVSGNIDLVFDSSNGYAFDAETGTIWGIRQFQNTIGDMFIRTESNLIAAEEGPIIIGNSSAESRLAALGIYNNNVFQGGINVHGANSDTLQSTIDIYTNDILRASIDSSGDWDMKNNEINAISVINLGSPSELTISGGIVTRTNSYHTIDTEGNLPTDDLNCIEGGVAGDLLYLFGTSGGRIVTFKNNNCATSANRMLIQGGDVVPTNEAEGISCIKRSFGWLCNVIGNS